MTSTSGINVAPAIRESSTSVTLSKEYNVNRDLNKMLLTVALVGTLVTMPSYGVPNIASDKSVVYGHRKNFESYSSPRQDNAYVALADFARELERRSKSLSLEESELWYEKILSMSESGIPNF